MPFYRKTLQLLMVTAIAGSCLAQKQKQYARDRYQLIVDRSPFGAEDVDLTPELNADSPQVQQAQQELRLCFLMKSETSGEVRAGFQNLKAAKNDPKSVILMEGESFRSMKLVDIDLAESTATLEYNGTPVTFELSKARAPAPAARNRATPSAQQPARRFGGGFRSRTPPQTPPQPQEEELTPEEREQRIAEIREKLQEQQMEIIRQGQPPLPIQLTPDQDDQLVAEGVLPPIEEEEQEGN